TLYYLVGYSLPQLLPVAVSTVSLMGSLTTFSMVSLTSSAVLAAWASGHSSRMESWICSRILQSVPASFLSTATMAIFMMSAALPWNGILTAWRMAASRTMKLEDLTSGVGRRRPYMVST